MSKWFLYFGTERKGSWGAWYYGVWLRGIIVIRTWYGTHKNLPEGTYFPIFTKNIWSYVLWPNTLTTGTRAMQIHYDINSRARHGNCSLRTFVNINLFIWRKDWCYSYPPEVRVHEGVVSRSFCFSRQSEPFSWERLLSPFVGGVFQKKLLDYF